MHMKSLLMILTFNHEIIKLYQTSISLVHANVLYFRYNYIPLGIFIRTTALYLRLTTYFSVVTDAIPEIHTW